MELLSVEIENFLTIQYAKLSLDNRGLVAVQGVNVDDSSASSNGSGKSSIADAISWVNYGETARGESGDNVVNDVIGKDCKVTEVLRETDGATQTFYRITRYRKHREGKNRLEVAQADNPDFANPQDLTKGTDKLTQELVVQILGCPIEVFNAAIYAGQEAMPDLPGMTDKMLKMLVEEGSGITRLQGAYEVARKRLTDADKAHVAAEFEHKSATDKVMDLRRRVGEANDSHRQWGCDNAGRYNAKAQEAKDAAAQAKQFDAQIPRARLKELEAQVADLDKRLDGRRAEEERMRELMGAVNVAQQAVTRCETDFRNKQTAVRAIKGQIEDIDQRVGTPCGECGKPILAGDIAEAKRLAGERLNEAALALRDLKAKLDDAIRAHQSAQETLSQFQATMTDVSEVLATQKLSRSEMEQIKAQERTLADLRSKATRLVEEAKAIKAEQNPWDEIIAKLNAELDTAESTLSDKTAAVAIAQRTLELAGDAVKVFGPAGVRAHILDTVTPFLNQRTAEYIGTLSDGNISVVWSTLTKTAKGELREKFNIEVQHAKGAKTFKGLSGGEKRKVRLATAMALQDLVASRATKHFPLFIADEVDHALDPAGLERLMGILDAKAKERGTVLVISHNELSDWCRQVLTVTKQDGLSTVDGVLVTK